NELIPGPRELSATILIEIADKAERERFLVEAKGLEGEFSLVVGGERCPGRVEPSRISPERTTAVHYVKFDLTEGAERALRSVRARDAAARTKPEDLSVELVCTHP